MAQLIPFQANECRYRHHHVDPFYFTRTATVAPTATGELSLLLNALQFAFKFIAHNIRRAELVNLIGVSGSANSTGDVQKKLDVIGDEIFINAMRSSNNVKVLVSEEQEDLIVFPGGGTYAVCTDPIDGSSNIDAGVSVGTIFVCTSCKRGLLVASVMSCVLVRRWSLRVHHVRCICPFGIDYRSRCQSFTLDTQLGEFILTHPNLKLPDTKNIYSLNEGYSNKFPEYVQDYLKDIKKEGYSLRYIGLMVADVHRTLLYGGIFAYPTLKLRVLYECFPMALLMEQAGGSAVTIKGERILDILPKGIHDKSSIVLGSKGEVEKYLKHVPK